MNLYVLASATFGSEAAYFSSAGTSTLLAMFSPQWQMYTPMRQVSFAGMASPSGHRRQRLGGHEVALQAQ